MGTQLPPSPDVQADNKHHEPQTPPGSPSREDTLPDPYQPLGPHRDRTRLLKIAPRKTWRNDEVIVCTLSEVAFVNRPKFDALSYRWGDGPACRQIILNGVPYSVKENLWGALRFLRSQDPDKLYWIDALCIDQRNFAERNVQVQMMHHIYFRAQCVVVWLGRNHFLGPTDLGHSMLTMPSERLSPMCRSDREQLAHRLSANGYWNRLWIIQEISRGHDIKVCFETSDSPVNSGAPSLPGVELGQHGFCVRWDDFICFMKMCASEPEGPLRLDKLRKEKYAESSTLIHLLEEHKDTLCQDRKDKVYGLVGLAINARDFPIDYEKSHFEIWTDTMEFMNRNNLFEGRDVVKVGALVKFLLMDADSSPIEHVQLLTTPERSHRQVITDEDPKSFALQAAILGRVICVGPQAHEVVGSLDKVDEWMYQVHTNYKDDPRNAHKESDGLIRDILGMDEETLSKKCFDCKGSVQWKTKRTLMKEHLAPLLEEAEQTEWYRSSTTAQQSDESDEGRPKKSRWNFATSVSTSTLSTPTEQPEHNQEQDEKEQQPFCTSRIFQIRRSHNGKSQPTSFKMGLASSDISEGDLVCWFESLRRGVVIRCLDPWKKSTKKKPTNIVLEVVGTAVVAEDLKHECLGRGQREDWADNRPQMNVYLDARALFTILCD